MFYNAPQFWRHNSWISKVLQPLSYIYRFISLVKYRSTRPKKVSEPIICVGNIVMGGAGKTPVVLALIDLLHKKGFNPHVLSRGYGAVVKESVKVEPKSHNYLHVGDEALLHAKKAPTWAGKNRYLSAKLAIRDSADIIIMDDGLQNNSLTKSLSILVIDSYQGIGNGKVFPAGPLRESLKAGLKKVNMVIIIGDKKIDIATDKPIFYAKMVATKKIKPRSIIAFAGLGYPEKFRHTLKGYGFEVKRFFPFPDHHPYTRTDMEKMLRYAEKSGLDLITTEKDMLRIPLRFQKMVKNFPIELKFDEEENFLKLILKELKKTSI